MSDAQVSTAQMSGAQMSGYNVISPYTLGFLPCFLFPSVFVHCIISFSKPVPVFLVMSPKYDSFLLAMDSKNSPATPPVSNNTHSLVHFSFHDVCRIYWWAHCIRLYCELLILASFAQFANYVLYARMVLLSESVDINLCVIVRFSFCAECMPMSAIGLKLSVVYILYKVSDDGN